MLTISELAKAGGVGVETIRFYQRRKLLEAPAKPRRDAGIRHYGESDIRQLRFVRAAQQAGFTLAEIAGLLALDKGRDRRRVREMARLRIAVLDEEIARLQIARQSLSGLAQICAHGDDGPCPIIESFSS
ncbi:MAG: MerR family transcriptional regulator [Sphingomonadales bacterium]|jgi:MerR family mercuric resistance operon transcriptional regulator|nr:MerR family transcriptional regulator [Sphingomonadales bacterium]MBK9004359.1 MerR family transcriptional regulator [Sphingomonadales bacterium]MBK9269536.1 MerR family transcriptional regulator [Sphingomonadales bacterium]MBP6434337.1 MerR family transcriptional regulator [Sphingorhabdus sp.]